MKAPTITTDSSFNSFTNEWVTTITIRQKVEPSLKTEPYKPLTVEDISNKWTSPYINPGSVTCNTNGPVTGLRNTVTPTMSALRPLSVEDVSRITSSFASNYDTFPGLQSIQSNIPLKRL